MKVKNILFRANSSSTIGTGHVIPDKDNTPIILPRHLVQDIDTLEDWKHTEVMYRFVNECENI